MFCMQAVGCKVWRPLADLPAGTNLYRATPFAMDCNAVSKLRPFDEFVKGVNWVNWS